ncbi:unnamed protein product [Arctia plantaginis]|uniref:RNase H type-1 domain-containing protein n=1 Tax=Arctia plantaginis TaxID=874455 RepID=A0A8S1AB57_ARCPL|nr:unnamed protein product [Arctia plantaginis]
MLNEDKHIVLQWVPSHIGLGGNSIVDSLAKQSTFMGISVPREPYFTDLLPLVRERCINMWKEYFDERSRTVGIWYKTIQPCPSHVLWFADSDLSGQEVVTALRLRSGHMPLNSFTYMMKKSSSPNCTICNVREDVYHIMVECQRNKAERDRFQMKHGISLRSVGVCNTILSMPVSDQAKLWYKIVNLGFKDRCS